MAQQIETEAPSRQPARPAPRGTAPVRPEKPARGGRSLRLTLMMAAAVIAAVLFGLHFYAQSQMYQGTDDAFIEGHIISVAPKVAGRVEQVLVNDNQLVRKGDLMAVLDPRDLAAARKQKAAALESTDAQAGAVQATIDQAVAHVSTLRATVEADKATAEATRAQAEKAGKDLQRAEDLFQKKVSSPQDLDAARAADQTARAQLEANLKKVTSDEAQVAEAQAQVKTYFAVLRSVQAQGDESNANLQTAELNESYTEIRAPEDGRVTRKAVEAGNYVQTGQTLFAFIPKDIWVNANFKESQIGRFRAGLPVEITVDALGDRKFAGHIDSIQAGSGARFSLLPPENATGNYVKVVQRVPVKIVFDQLPQVELPLGPGESVVPTVKVQDFRYTPAGLLRVGLATVALLGVLFWFRSRPKKAAKAG
ncbi:MAG TPA: HlyD family secretion protein [Chthoniobacterales bacterium]